MSPRAANQAQSHDGDDAAHEGRTPNRLANETSPYLLQHAYNPVDWYPWGEEAFEAARTQNKPIFLSIGYSTCYWCHVMERESFEDEATAKVMNEHFVSIKVDREERPDVDEIYMTATQLMTGHGGWPMSVFLDPETLNPFLAGTYFPPEPRHGMASFTQVLEAVTQAWDRQRDTLRTQASTVAEAVTDRLARESAPQLLSADQVTIGVRQIMQSYDSENGGFGRAPKFPQPVFLELLMGAAWEREDVRAAVQHTLEAMALGGMYDQLGGGFHRYSTDAQWIVPHFEKMLYDNGQLLAVYAEAFERTQHPLFEKIVRETVNYALREMQDAGGAFYSAQDAEVDAREGLSYLWTPDEVKEALADAGLEADVDFALDVFGVSRGTNFTDPHFPEDGPKNVLVFSQPDAKDLGERFDRVRQAMLEFRQERKQPNLDDKILAGWNGLMIAGLADAGRIFGEQAWIDEAARVATYVLERMQHAELGLLRVSRDDHARVPAFLEDYAFMIYGTLALHRATDDKKWLDVSETLTNEANERFFDEMHGGYFETLSDQPDLLVRSKVFYDGALPSGNGVMAMNLVTLHERTGKIAYLERAADVLRAASPQLALGPSTSCMSALALHKLLAMDVLDVSTDDETTPREAEVRPGKVVASVENMTADGVGMRFDLVLTIAPGYHINAHEPGVHRLVGLAIETKEAGAEPVELTPEYPRGEALDDSSELGRRMRVHTKRVVIPVHANRAGRFSFTVRYQACSEMACLAPATVDVDVDFTPGH